MTFREFMTNHINESPVKMIGDAPFETLENHSKSLRDFDKLYTKIGNIDDYDVYSDNRFNIIYVGKIYLDKIQNINRFGIVAELVYEASLMKSNNKLINNKSYIKISSIQVRETNQRSGISTKLYSLLLNKFIILSDKIQYEGAVNLWKSFTRVSGVRVYIYDSIEDKIISKFTGHTPDEHVWTQDRDWFKHRIQLIMIK